MVATPMLGVWGALLVMALVAAAVSLWLHFRQGSIHQIVSQVRQLDLDLSELFDKVEHWTRRERVRKMRDGQEAALTSQQLPARGSPEYKQLLRKRQRENGQ